MNSSIASTCSAPALAAPATTPAPAESLPLFRPSADVVEREDAFVVTLDVPGVAESDIDIRHERGLLNVVAARPRTHADDTRILLREFGPVRFSRSFRLPEDGSVDASRIGARLAAGVLEITLPKSEQSKPRRIPVQG